MTAGRAAIFRQSVPCCRGNNAAEVWGRRKLAEATQALHWFQGRMPFAQLGPVLSMIALRMFLFKELKSFLAVDHLLLKFSCFLTGPMVIHKTGGGLSFLPA